MFENIPPVRPGETREPEDIFAAVESRAVRPPTLPGAAAPSAMPAAPKVSFFAAYRGLAIILVAVVGLGAVLGGGWLLYKSLMQPASAPAPEANINAGLQNQVPGGMVNTTPPVNEAPAITPAPAAVDTDGDDLPDEAEIILGTNPNLNDTDGDGLTDGEEVKVYKTDPLKADTDGDGYSDGTEIAGGYNPLGSGKLAPEPNL